jgi:nitrite reductase (NADH) small subunit
MRPVDLDGTPIVLFRDLDGTYYALRDSCAHMGAPLSRGRLEAKMEAADVQGSYFVSTHERIIRCPWHGYEFDIRSGRCAGDPDRVSVRVHNVETRDGRVLVER